MIETGLSTSGNYMTTFKLNATHLAVATAVLLSACAQTGMTAKSGI